MVNKKNMERYLENLEPTVRKNLKIVSSEDLGQDYLYHLSTDRNIKKFTPRLTRRSMEDEDRTLPRISTSPSLVGCILGHKNIIKDFTSLERKKNVFHGGHYIYGFKFDLAVVPKPKLLPDVNETDEVWIVPHSSDNWEIKSDIIATFFILKLTSDNNRSNKRIGVVRQSIQIVLDIQTDAGLKINNQLDLLKGYWVLDINNVNNGYTVDESEIDNVVEITEEKYKELKKTNVSLLSIDEYPSAKW